MKNLFEPGRGQEVKARLALLKVDSPRQWGRMSAAQAMAHCAIALEWAVRDRTPEPMWFLPRMIGRVIKPLALGNDDPMKRNSPTTKSLIIADERPLDTERQRLCDLVDRFVAGGSAGCTMEPHPFFGKLTPEQWAILMYKHLDHHLRQFGV